MNDANKPDESLAWTVRLSDKSPKKVLVIFGFAVTAGIAGFVLFGQPLLGLLGFAIIVATTAEFWLGTRYRLGPDGASAGVGPSLTQINWPDVKRVVEENDLIKLSPLVNDGRLDPFRGVVLRTTEENRERVRALIRQHCSEHVRFLGL